MPLTVMMVILLVMMVMPENNLPLSKCSSCLKVALSAISSCSSPTNSIHLDDKDVTKSNADNHYDVAQLTYNLQKYWPLDNLWKRSKALVIRAPSGSFGHLVKVFKFRGLSNTCLYVCTGKLSSQYIDLEGILAINVIHIHLYQINQLYWLGTLKSKTYFHL